jgi:light-harvesting complex I chlorophyll a/b binding protein 2
MALVSASSSSTTAVAALPRNGQQRASSTSFLGGKTLLRQATEAARPSFAVRAAADPDRPIWFPGSTPPPWLDGRSAADPDPWSRLRFICGSLCV